MTNNLYVAQFELGGMQNFNYLVADKLSKQAIVIDPDENTEPILEEIKKEDFVLKFVLLTHGHFDHVGGVPELVSDFGIQAVISSHELPIYTPDFPLKKVQDREKIQLGEKTIECLHTPGHSPGCQCFYVDGNLFTGDTLFIDAIGRTDLPGGSAKTLFESLQRIKSLPDNTVIWPGHNYGLVTHESLKNLKQSNPFLKCDNVEQFVTYFG